MPFEVTWTGRGYYKRVYGAVSGEDFLQSITTVQNHPEFDSMRFGINDFLDASAINIKPVDIDLYAATSIGAALSNPRMQIAIVTTDPGITALVREYIRLAPFPTVFFETVAAARQWARSL